MILIADSGATKTTWCLTNGKSSSLLHTQGISPYFMTAPQIVEMLRQELLPALTANSINELYYYGTGCSNPANIGIVKSALTEVFPHAAMITVDSDLAAAAHALCGNSPGVACILGTGSNSCVFDGKKVTKNNPAPGYILGDEGSGAFLGKKIIQYFIYNTFDEELQHKFSLKFRTDYTAILHKVYKEPFPNRYLASFTPFLSENRGHYMIENIIEDGLSEFFYNHLYKYNESWTMPIHFVGSIAFHFEDVLRELCSSFELDMGKILQAPMDGLIVYHSLPGNPIQS